MIDVESSFDFSLLAPNKYGFKYANTRQQPQSKPNQLFKISTSLNQCRIAFDASLLVSKKYDTKYVNTRQPQSKLNQLFKISTTLS